MKRLLFFLGSWAVLFGLGYAATYLIVMYVWKDTTFFCCKRPWFVQRTNDWLAVQVFASLGAAILLRLFYFVYKIYKTKMKGTPFIARKPLQVPL